MAGRAKTTSSGKGRYSTFSIWHAEIPVMETQEISVHQANVYKAVRDSNGKWLTAVEIANISGVATRTARAHALKFVKLGVFDQAELHPGHRYKMATKADKRNRGIVERMENALKIFSQ